MRRLSEGYAVSPQLTPEDVAAAARAGVRTLVNNRPDGEAPDQPAGAEIERAARAAGLDYVAIPFSGRPGEAEIAATLRVLDEAEGPVLAFCKTGGRCAGVWAQAQARRGEGLDRLLAAGSAAGYDLRPWLGLSG